MTLVHRACSPRLSVVVVVATLVACSGDQDRRLYVQAVPVDGAADVPELPAPFTEEDVENLRTGFDWSTTTPLREYDEFGRPALYYTEVYLRDTADLDLLSLARIPHDALPLFEEERGPWVEPGTIGTIAFAHTEEGASLAYAFMPGSIYNLARSSAEDGEPVFEAVRLRAPPIVEAYHAEGYLNLDYLIADGFTYGLSEAELIAPREPSVGTSSVSAPLLGRVFRAIVRLGRGVADAFRTLGNVFLPKRDFSLRLRVLNSEFFDPSIDPGDPRFEDNVMRQAWGARRGEPIRIQGARIAVGARTTVDLARLDDNGYVEARVVRSQRFTVNLRFENDAAVLTHGGLWPNRFQVYAGDGRVRRDEDIAISADIRSGHVNVFAQLTDSHNYVREVAGRQIPTATVSIRQEDARRQRSGVPCFSLYGLGTWSLGHGRGWSVFSSAVMLFAERDMTIRGPDRDSRAVPTHEYGHFVMCSMLHSESPRSFAQAWGEVTGNAIRDPDASDDRQATSVAEAWADFFAAQVAGATLYVTPPGSTMRSFNANYCTETRFAPETACLETNYGGPRGEFPASPVDSTRDLAVVASILYDAVDFVGGEGVNAPSGPFLWDIADRDTHQANVVRGETLRDETVALPGPRMDRIFHEWARDSNRLTVRSFLNAIASAATSSGASWNQVCDMFALHTPTGLCGDLINVEGIEGALVPIPPELVELVRDPSCDGDPKVLISWRNLGSVGRSYRVELFANGVTVGTWDGEYQSNVDGMVGGRDGRWSEQELLERGLPGLAHDVQYVLSVRTLGPTEQSEPLYVPFRTYAARMSAVTATPIPGGVRLAWLPVAATDYRVSEYSTGTTARRDDAAVVSGSSVDVLGLSTASEYAFSVAAQNADGESNRSCRSSSSPPLLSPLPDRILHVSHTFGSDLPPADGSALLPFASVRTALAAVVGTQATLLRIETGVFLETGALSLPAAALTVSGGFTVLPDGSWVAQGDAPTLVAVPAVQPGSPVAGSMTLFGAPRSTLSAMHVPAGSSILLRDVEIQAIDLPSGSATCGIAAEVDAGGSLRLENSHVSTTTNVPSGACRVALLVRGGGMGSQAALWTDSGSSVVGASLPPSGTVGANASVVGVLAETTARIRLVDSALYGLSRPATVGASPGGMWVGIVATGSPDISVSRSEIGAAEIPSAATIAAGSLYAIRMLAGGALRVDNSFLHTPTGGSSNLVLSASGPSSGTGTSVEVVWSTISAGADFLDTLPVAIGNSRAAEFLGRVSSLRLVNNILSVANRHQYTTVQVLSVPQDSMTTPVPAPLEIRGNAFSARVGTELVHVACGEFMGCGDTEANINNSSWFGFYSTWSVSMNGNYALYGSVGIGPESERRRIFLSPSGEVLSVNSLGSPLPTPTGTLTLLQWGGVPWTPQNSAFATTLDGRTRVGAAGRSIGAYDYQF